MSQPSTVFFYIHQRVKEDYISIIVGKINLNTEKRMELVWSHAKTSRYTCKRSKNLNEMNFLLTKQRNQAPILVALVFSGSSSRVGMWLISSWTHLWQQSCSKPKQLRWNKCDKRSSKWPIFFASVEAINFHLAKQRLLLFWQPDGRSMFAYHTPRAERRRAGAKRKRVLYLHS